MDTLAIGSLKQLPPLEPLSIGTTPNVAGASTGGTFQQLLSQVLSSSAETNAKADQAIQALATGQADDLHTVTLAVAQADLAFRMLLELRNRLTEAYQEVMRMQV